MNLSPRIHDLENYIPGKTIPGAVKLSSNENPLGSSPRAVQAIKKSLKDIHRYPNGGSSELKEALAGLWRVRPEQVCVANGSDEVFLLTAAAFLGPGDEILTARETFSQYTRVARIFGAGISLTGLKKGCFDLESLRSLVTARTRIIFLCNPNNPTGTYLNHEDLERFLRSLPGNLLVVMDEAYAEFADAPDFPDGRSLLNEFPNLMITRTFSKIYGLAGLRIGYAVGSEDIIAGTEQVSLPFNVNVPAQKAASAALGDEKFFLKSRKMVRSEKLFMEDALRKRGISFYPSQSNFICIDLDRETAPLWESIARRGLSVRTLESFALPQMIRYTFGLRRNNKRFLAILDEIL